MRTGLLLLLSALLLTACGGKDAVSTSGGHGPHFTVEKTATAGPVTLTIRLTKDHLGLADDLVLEQEVHADKGFEAELPEFDADEFAEMGVTSVDEDPPEREKGATILRRRLTLEPQRSGKLTIPAFEAWFSKDGSKSDSSVLSKPIPITVKPIANAEKVKLPSFRPLIAEKSTPRGGISPWWASLAAIPLLLAAGVLVARRKRKGPPPRPAHEIAFEALRCLAAAGLLEKDEVERFFVVLSAILREYVERRFGVRAPELTTKEFLDEASRDRRLSGHRTALSDFLTLADRVKFARFSPEEADVKAAFDRARDFVETTRERPEEKASSPGREVAHA